MAVSESHSGRETVGSNNKTTKITGITDKHSHLQLDLPLPYSPLRKGRRKFPGREGGVEVHIKNISGMIDAVQR